MARLIDADKVEELLIFLKEQCEKEQAPIMGAMWGSFQAVLEFVREQPTIEPVQRGKWVEDITCNDIVMCNACGNEAYFDLDIGTYMEFDYCPHCGAKMERDEE